eukprot:jgi/Pico_ML_1/50955/g2069.t1
MASGSGMMRAAKMAEAPTALQAALRRVRSEEALATLGSLAKNAAMFPKEEKYRRVRLSNDKIRERIVDVEGAIEVLEELGWKHEGDAMVLPANVSATMVQFRQVEEAREKLVREQRRKITTAGDLGLNKNCCN